MKQPGRYVVALICVWGSTPFWVPAFASWIAGFSPGVVNRDLGPAGQIGDMFGTINALFSGLALIGVVYGLFLQTIHKKRERQPEVFARLSVNSEERPIVLARNIQTVGGRIQFTLEVPIYVEAGASAIAFNVQLAATYCGASSNKRLLLPIFTRSKFETPESLYLTIDAENLVQIIPDPVDIFPLGALDVSVEYQNQQEARWGVTATYDIGVRSAADAQALAAWVTIAAAPANGIQQIELSAKTTAWRSYEL